MKRFTSIQLGGGMYASTKIAALSFILSIFFIPVASFSQCNIACNDVVQISIGADCIAEITPDALLEGTLPAGSFTITFNNGEVGTATSGSALITGIDWSSVLGTMDYTVTANDCNNSCWGTAIVEQNVFPEYNGATPCTYIPEQVGSTDGEITLANVATGVEVDIRLPDCSALGVLPTFTLDGPIKFACSSALSGWCTFNCGYTIAGLSTSGGFTTWTLRVTVSDVALATEYLNTPGAELICKVNYNQPACVPCETWCGGNPPAFVTMVDLIDNLALTTGDCVKNITNLREVVKTEGDVCDGIITVVEYYGDFTQHGETQTRLLLSQAYKQLAIPLIKPDGSQNNNIIFPSRKVVHCGESTDPIDMKSYPVFHNLWRDSISYPDTCLIVHYLVAVDTVSEPIEIVPGVWSIQDVVKKELRDSTRCAPDSSITARIITNPYEPLYPSKFCNLISTYSDQVTPICGNGKKIIRDWTLVDWCKAKLVVRSQVIEEKDIDAPVGPSTHTTHVTGMAPWSCEAIFDFDLPVFTDKCDDSLDITFDIINSEGVWVPVEALKAGTYLIDFIARDDCNNFSKPHRDTLVVIDNVPPISVCKDKLVVSITPDMNGGVAKIESDEFDKGSHDGGCGEIAKKQVIRVEDYIESVDHAFGGMSFAGLPVTCHPAIDDITIVDKDKFGDALPPVTNVLSIWSNSVKFCCEDIGTDKQVILRVWDQANNYNDCVVKVEVQDKLGTLFSCPPADTIKCTEYSKDVLFGDAQTDFVCSDANTTYEDDISGLNSCGAGRVIRIWSSDNGSGKINTCPQIITVRNENVFDPTSIRWPIHYKGGIPGTGVRLEPKDSVCVEIPGQTINFAPVLSCTDDDPACTPEYTEAESCGLVGISMSADTIFQTDNTCMKVIKRWTVIDWCTWAPNGNPNAEVGDDENDTATDQFQLVEDWCIDSGCIFENEGSAYYRYLPSAQGGYVERDGYYTYDQILLYHDDTDPQFLTMEIDTLQPGTEGSCLGNIALINTAKDEGFCGSELLQWYVILLDSTGTQFGNIQTGLGNAFGFTVSDIPLGKYTIVWNVKDGCGNEATQNTAVELQDTSVPTPICIQNISTAVMNTTGEVEIWAADFDPDLKSFDPCDDRVYYSFSPDSIVPNLTLTCLDVLSDVPERKVWVHDITGNAAACTVKIRVDDNGICDDYVHDCTESGEEVEGGKFITDVTDLEEVTVCISGNNTSFDAKVWENIGNSGFVITDADGNIMRLPTGNNFDFAGEAVGVCYLWHISSVGPLAGLEVGNNASDIQGCFSLSNPIIVTKVDSGDACDGGTGNAAITGNIATAYGEYIGQARVKLDNPDMPEFPISKMTSDLTGNYAFASNPMYTDYSLSVEKNDNHINGVSTLDLVFIQHHILGLKPLDSAYKIIAADVNNDQKITASDLVQLRKLILGVISELPTNNSWRFIDATQTFDNIYSPWPFTESLDITDLDVDMAKQDFVGIKTGDVNGSANPSSLKQTEVRNNNFISLSATDMEYNTGDLVELKINSEEFEQVSGLQFTLTHTGLELIGINSSSIDIDSDNIASHGAYTSVSWNSDELVSVDSDIMTFVFVSTSDNLVLSESIEISDRITTAEIYTGADYDINKIKLDFELPLEGNTQFELLQNEPNPFSAFTEIGFRLPKADEATLKLFDVTGRLLHSQTGVFGQGLNKITISSDLIGSRGLIYYSLESGNYSATRKMISLK